MDKMTVANIIESYLRMAKYDGLVSNECQCSIGEICHGDILKCSPAYRHNDGNYHTKKEDREGRMRQIKKRMAKIDEEESQLNFERLDLFDEQKKLELIKEKK